MHLQFPLLIIFFGFYNQNQTVKYKKYVVWNEETDITVSKIERKVFNDPKERKHA